ncbi:MAG: hypothetical protein AABZ28_08400, partial [Nitrospinota bacterium]
MNSVSVSRKNSIRFSDSVSKKILTLTLTLTLLASMLFLLPMIVSAESVMKEGYRNDYLPQGITPRHEMDKAENWIAIFEHERRDEWQEPEKVIENMKLKEGDVVADIG